MTGPRCPSCHNAPRRTTQYLCSGCWGQLPTSTRRQLIKKDGYAMRRLRKLHLALDKGIPIHEIRISV